MAKTTTTTQNPVVTPVPVPQHTQVTDNPATKPGVPTKFPRA